MDFITKNYPDFNWEKYRDMNPYLYFMNLRTPEDYTFNFLNEGRFVGRRYKDEHINNYTIHVLLATIGNDSIFNILKCLKNELKEDDYLTVVFDASNKNIYNVSTYCKENIKSKVNIIYEEKNLGYWGHGIRNKHNKLEGDFIYHIDDDDHIVEGAFDKVRKILKDKDTIYIFKIVSEINQIIWINPEIKLNQISTQCGFIPSNLNDKSFWEYKYGGDYNFYNNLQKQTEKIIFINEIIYKKKLKHK